MKKYFLVKIKHAERESDGSTSFVTDQFIVFAMTYADAEMLAYDYAEQHWSGTFRIMGVTKQSVIGAYGLAEGEEGEVFKLTFEYESETDGRLNKIQKFREQYFVVDKSLIRATLRLEQEMVDNVCITQNVVAGSKLKIVDYICDEIDPEVDLDSRALVNITQPTIEYNDEESE